MRLDGLLLSRVESNYFIRWVRPPVQQVFHCYPPRGCGGRGRAVSRIVSRTVVGKQSPNKIVSPNLGLWGINRGPWNRLIRTDGNFLAVYRGCYGDVLIITSYLLQEWDSRRSYGVIFSRLHFRL